MSWPRNDMKSMFLSMTDDIWLCPEQSIGTSRLCGCHARVGMPELGHRWSTYWQTNRSNRWRCNHYTSAGQAPIPCIPVASPGLKPIGRVWRADVPALKNRRSVAVTPGQGTCACFLRMKHHYALGMPAQPAQDEYRRKYKWSTGLLSTTRS